MILESKLLVPNVSETIFRERLHVLLEKAPQKKLITVIASAGYGKTVLIAQAVRHSNWKSVWYRLGESDQNLAVFLSYLIAGARKITPSFGEKTQQRIDQIRNPKNEWQEIITLLIKELETDISGDLYIILEDYHRIQMNREINQTLDFLVENMPPNLHIVIISRIDPGIPLSRLRATRELIEIKTENLTFTDNETDLLCRNLFKISLEAKELTTLRQKTGGWVTGLILFYHSAKGDRKADFRTQRII